MMTPADETRAAWDQWQNITETALRIIWKLTEEDRDDPAIVGKIVTLLRQQQSLLNQLLGKEM